MEIIGLRVFRCIAFVVLTSTNDVVRAVTINDTETLLTDLLSNYNKYIRPATEQLNPVIVGMELHVKSIQEFDEVQEKFSFAGAVVLTWNDPRLSWKPAYYGYMEQLVIPYHLVWTPEIILSTAASSRNYLTQDWNTVRIYADGTTLTIRAALIESTCLINVRNYPFDTQTCEVSFFSLGYKNTELLLSPSATKVNFNIFKSNALWKIIDSEIETEVIAGGEIEMHFKIHMERKSSYMILNILLPVLFLSLLNALVFLLLPESGERIGYCVTTLLAIAVYMTIIADVLPQTSDPVPLISYKLVADLITSAVIVFVTILNMRFRNNDEDDPVPRCLVAMYRCVKCRQCRKRTVTPMTGGDPAGHLTISVLPNGDTIFGTASKAKTDEKHTDNKMDIVDNIATWKNISNMIDGIAFVFFTFSALVSFTVFVLMIRNGSF